MFAVRNVYSRISAVEGEAYPSNSWLEQQCPVQRLCYPLLILGLGERDGSCGPHRNMNSFNLISNAYFPIATAFRVELYFFSDCCGTFVSYYIICVA